MQYPQRPFGSQSTIKQLYRQYSTTFRNNQVQKNIIMTQSSNLPFDKFYNAFNSTGNIKNFTLDRFKHSQAKSIIEKLMQTKQFSNKNPQDETAEIQNLQPIQLKGPIPLTKTQEKIFYQVINLITQIQEIKQKTNAEHEEFIKLKVQLESQGIQFPQIDQKKQQSGNQTFKRYTTQQLENFLEANEKMQAEIEAITKQLTNINASSNPLMVIESYANKNGFLKKQLMNLKHQIMNAGGIDDQDIFEMNSRIEQLKTHIFRLQQKRMAKLSDNDLELRYLKQQNEGLRLRTIELLKRPVQTFSQRKLELIRVLKFQQEQKANYFEKINQLKNHFQTLLSENSSLKTESVYYGTPQYEGPLQVESKVSSFPNYLADYRSSYGNGKENYLSSYQFPKQRISNYGPHELNILKSTNLRYTSAYFN